MAQDEGFDWSPNIPFNIYKRDYPGFISRLVKVLSKNSKTKFIPRGPKNREYVRIMMETHQDDRALEAHMARDNLYVPAFGLRGSNTIFRVRGAEDFEGEREMNFGEGYQDMTRDLKEKEIYTIDFSEFIAAVETLISEMGSKDLDSLVTSKWAKRIFRIISVIAEGARNKIVSISYNDSMEKSRPSKTPWMWTKVVFNSWELFSNKARSYGGDIKLAQLTKDERDMLLAINLPNTADDVDENLEKVLARGDLCRAALNILCGHLKPLQASSSSSTSSSSRKYSDPIFLSSISVVTSGSDTPYRTLHRVKSRFDQSSKRPRALSSQTGIMDMIYKPRSC